MPAAAELEGWKQLQDFPMLRPFEELGVSGPPDSSTVCHAPVHTQNVIVYVCVCVCVLPPPVLSLRSCTQPSGY